MAICDFLHDDPATVALHVLGGVAALQLALTLGRVLIALVGSGVAPRSYGKWAVVTGATDGIGLAYAHELARKKMNIVLISRSKDRLDASADAIKAAHGVETQVIQADFSDTSDSVYEHIGAQLKPIAGQIGVLVNNVGISYEHAEYLTSLPEERVQKLIDINVTATTAMTRLVLPHMEEKKKGAVINVSSAAGVLPCGDPLYAVYSASKAYVDFLSRSLHAELRAKGVFVQCQVPYFVTTKLSKLRRASLLIPTPDTYARAAVSWIGRGGASVVPYGPHAVQHWLMSSLPQSLLEYLVLGHHHGIRKRALKKKQAAKKEE